MAKRVRAPGQEREAKSERGGASVGSLRFPMGGTRRTWARASLVVVAWALALGLAACGTDFAAAPGAADATSGDDATTDAAADVGDAPTGDAPRDGPPSSEGLRRWRRRRADRLRRRSDIGKACCVLLFDPGRRQQLPSHADERYPCDGLSAVCATDGGFIKDPAGGTAHCWCAGLGGQRGHSGKPYKGQGCCGGTVVACH